MTVELGKDTSKDKTLIDQWLCPDRLRLRKCSKYTKYQSLIRAIPGQRS